MLQSSSMTSTISLVVANLVPIIGVAFFKWDVFTILLLYWSESAIIGFYNILKIAVTAKHKIPTPREPRGAAYVVIPFFVLHYGAFMYGHLMVLLQLFAPSPIPVDTPLIKVITLLLAALPAVVMLFLSHGVSFISNFIKKQEYAKNQIIMLMFAPYQRIILIHLTVMLGGALVLFLKLPLFGLLAMIGLKIITDLYAHHRSHTGGHRLFDIQGLIQKKLEEMETKKRP